MTSVHNGEKNCLLELFKFIFTIWLVAKNTFFSYEIFHFNLDYVAISFIFILSGFYILENMSDTEKLPFFKGLGKLMIKALKEFGVGFVLIVFTYIITLIAYDAKYVTTIVLYFPAMLLAFALVYTIKRLSKSNKSFIITCIVLTVACFAISALCYEYTNSIYYSNGLFDILESSNSIGDTILYESHSALRYVYIIFNSFATVLLGVCLSKIKQMPSNLKPLTIALLIIVSIAIPAAMVFNFKYLIVLILLPLLIYLSSALDPYSPVYEFLGSMCYHIIFSEIIFTTILWNMIFSYNHKTAGIIIFFLTPVLALLIKLFDHTIKYILDDK